MNKKLKIGIIGCSQIAENSVIPAIKKSEFAELQFIGSRSNQKGEKFAKNFHCKNFGSYEDVLDDKETDIVYISLPVGLHEKWCIKAAKAGKHILCEKSSTTSLRSAKKMIKFAKQNNVRLLEGLMFRFHPSHKEVLKIIYKNKLGKIFSFYGRYGFPSIPKNNIRYSKELGGGILNDAACYPICASKIIFQDLPESVYCSYNIEPKSNVDEQIFLNLKYKNGQNAQIVSGYNLQYQNNYSIWCEKGNLVLERSYNIPYNMKPVITLETSKGKWTQKIPATNHFVLMIDQFSNEIIRKDNSEFDFEKDLIDQARILEAARISAKKRQVITLSKIK